MLKHILLREEDYWLIPASFLAIVFVACCLYVGVLQLRLFTGLIGFGGLYFVYYVLRRGYDSTHAGLHLLICLVVAILSAYGLYLLTN